MALLPVPTDVHLVRELTRWVGRHPLFDYSVQSAIGHNLLGGFCFAAVLFVYWVSGALDPRALGQRRIRLLSVMLGTALSITMCLVAARLVTVTPPNRQPELVKLFPTSYSGNPNTNSFPSSSTAVYACVAAGVFSLSRLLGGLLGLGVIFLVALPRVYVGGHYPSDILAGAALGLLGYGLARLLEPRWSSFAEKLCARPWLQVVVHLAVFGWLLQVATDFRDLVWLRSAVGVLLRALVGL